MRVVIDIETTDANDRAFVTWAPARALVRLVDAGTAPATRYVTLHSRGVPDGGRVLLGRERGDEGAPDLALELASDGTEVPIWVAGEFMAASREYGDVHIEAVDEAGAVIGSRALMVRIRKDATKLTAAERDRFLVALGVLNDAGAGPFKAFRDMHVAASVNEAHGAAGFLPWHRAYLLDLERSLQAIDATVALPYWRFDLPAPDLFAATFLGSPPDDPSEGDVIEFPPGHPLEFWRTDGTDRIERRPISLWSSEDAPPTEAELEDGTIVKLVITQGETLNLGGEEALYSAFRGMEGAPHGYAHTSFAGAISVASTAPKDPLFFLLHANVDRLWALWQWLNDRHSDDEASYSVLDSHRLPDNLGHKLEDTMWPWNGDRAFPRPEFDPPRAAFPDSPFIAFPGKTPRVRDMIDFHGVLSAEELGFGYDDVPFRKPTGSPIA